jgi:hypothetical protein
VEKEELKVIIEKLEQNASKETGTFGLYYEQHEWCYIKANDDGFKLFAIEMLKSVLDSEKVINNNEKNYIPFGFERKWFEGEVSIEYIKPIREERSKIENEAISKETFKHRIIKFLFISILVIILLSIIIGFYTIIKWVF